MIRTASMAATAARTVEVVVVAAFKVTARASHGQILDSVLASVEDCEPQLTLGEGAHFELHIDATHISEIGEAGGSL